MARLFDDVKVGDKITILRDSGSPHMVGPVSRVMKRWFEIKEYKFEFDGSEYVPNKSSRSNWGLRRFYARPWEQAHSDDIIRANCVYDITQSITKDNLQKLDLTQLRKMRNEVLELFKERTENGV